MMTKSDPLDVLLDVKKQLGLKVSDQLIVECYKIQKENQFNKERDTSKKIQALIETKILEADGSILL